MVEVSSSVALDLASLKSVRACAEGLLKKAEPFDVVIANAGSDGDAVYLYGEWLRDAVRHQSFGPLCSR